MGFDVGDWTVRVLEEGLPSLPDHLAPSQTIPVAVWRGKYHGAVLFVRLWRNGNIDRDCAITRRCLDGSWEQPVGWAGGGWVQEPLLRPENGWDGNQVLWLAHSASGGIRAVQGVASKRVFAIEVEQAAPAWNVPIDSPCGAFVVGLEAPGPAVLRALDERGRSIPGSEYTVES